MSQEQVPCRAERLLRMTRAQAIKIRQRQLSGDDTVTALELQQAVFILSKRRDKKVSLPKLPDHVQAMADAALCFNLGRAIKARVA